jgi:hypothetical protein
MTVTYMHTHRYMVEYSGKAPEEEEDDLAFLR